MEKKMVSAMMLTLLLTSMLTLAFNIQPAKAEPTTIIVPDDYPTIQGAINAANPGDTIIVSSGVYYENVVVNKSLTLTGAGPSATIIDGSGTGVVVTVVADYVHISGFTIRNGGKDGVRVDIFGHSNISGNNVTNNGWNGINLRYSDDNTIGGNNITSNTERGIYFESSRSDTVSGNNVTNNNGNGIELFDSYDNTISGNTAFSNLRGIFFDNSDYNNVSGNIVTSNRLDGMSSFNSGNNMVSGNTANNNNESGIGISGDNNTVSGNIANNHPYYGITVGGSNNTISGNTANNNYYGIVIGGTNNMVSGNTANNNTNFGIKLGYSGNNIISGNNVNNNRDYGVYLDHSDNNTISSNNANNNKAGVYLDLSDGNMIYGNDVNDNTYYGIDLEWSNNNSIYHNNFVNNTSQAHNYIFDNVWDDGYPSGGNYWSDYAGVDVYSGPLQNEPGDDGFGDTPYVIDDSNQDNYPLKGPWPWLIKNLDTNIYYLTIQRAIYAPETLDWHTILVDAGTYHEQIAVNKSLVLVGNAAMTIIDGNGIGTVVTVTKNNVTISGFTIRNSGNSWQDSGIRFPSNCIVTGNVITDNENGILAWDSSNNTITDNTVSDNDKGIWLRYSSSNNISGNIVSNNSDGVYLEISSNNMISDNTMAFNDFGTDLNGSDSNVVKENRVTNNGRGISLDYSGGNILRDNLMKDNDYNFVVHGKSLSDYIQDADASNTVDGRPICYWVNQHDRQVSADVGYVAIVNSTSITVRDLNLTKNGQGVLFVQTTNSTIENVNATNNFDAISLRWSNNNTIIGNTITDNEYGIHLNYSNNNIVHHNNFVNNTSQAHNYIFDNVWDDGYPSGGNYWGDYAGVDVYSGPLQNEPGGDDLGDTPYVIDANNHDNYPLMGPWPWYIKNLDTGLLYLTIQRAISASGTLDGHTILIGTGKYHEYVVVDKSLTLLGEDRDTTTIDVNGAGNAVAITSDNVTVSNLTIKNTGTAAYTNGIDISYRRNVTVKNTVVTGFWLGISLSYSANCTFSGNNFINNQVGGIYTFDSHNNTFIGNTLTANTDYGVYLDHSHNNTLNSNTITSNEYGIYLAASDRNTLSSNTITSNTRDGIYISVSDNNTVSGNTISSNTHSGIYFWVSCNNTVNGNTITTNEYGIYVFYYSHRNSFSGNTIASSVSDGIYVQDSHNNTFTENTITNNYLYGINLKSPDNAIYHNNFFGNTRQARSSGSTNTWDDGYPSDGNYWSDYLGIDLYSGPYQNETGSDCIGDTPYVIDASNRDNYPLMNPWMVPNGPTADFTYSPLRPVEDETITFDASTSVPGWNGTHATQMVNYSWNFGDGTPIITEADPVVTHNYIAVGTYTVTLNITDSQDLRDTASKTITTIYPHDVAIINVTPAKTVVGQGYLCRINVTAENQGNYTETFNVTVYANETTIETKEVTIFSGNSTTLTFAWNTSGFAKGNYTLSAYAWPVPGETDTADNTYTDGLVKITVAGDINGDGIVNAGDLGLLGAAWFSYPNSPNWNPNADVTGNGIVNAGDLGIIGVNWFKT